MSAQIQSITTVRKLYLKVTFWHQSLPIFLRFSLQKSTSFLVTVGSSFLGDFSSRQTIARIGSPASKNLPFPNGLNFPDFSVFPISLSRPFLAFTGFNASLIASAYDDKGCTCGQIPMTKVQTPIKTQTIKTKKPIMYEILLEIWSLIGHCLPAEALAKAGSSITSSFTSSRIAIFGHYDLGFDWPRRGPLGIIGHWELVIGDKTLRLPNSIRAKLPIIYISL